MVARQVVVAGHLRVEVMAVVLVEVPLAGDPQALRVQVDMELAMALVPRDLEAVVEDVEPQVVALQTRLAQVAAASLSIGSHQVRVGQVDPLPRLLCDQVMIWVGRLPRQSNF